MIDKRYYYFINYKLTKVAWITLLAIIQAVSFDFKYSNPFAFVAGGLSIFSLTLFIYFIVQQQSIKSIMFFSYLYGLAFFAWGLNWVYISMANFGGASLLFSILANLVVIVYLAIYWLIAGCTIHYAGKTNRIQKLVLAPLIISGLEWIRSYFLIGFPWLSLGYAQIDNILGKTSSIAGVHFTSFLVVIIAVIINMLVIYKKQIFYRKRAYLISFFVLTILIVSVAINSTKLPRNKSVALLQGNIDVITKFDPKEMEHSLETYLDLTNQTIRQKTPDLVVWPETAIPYFYQQVDDIINIIKNKQQQKKFSFISGVPFINTENNNIFNAIVFMPSPPNEKNQFYYKENLLPFGEYIPFRNVFSFFKDYVTIPMSDFSRGTIIQPPFQAKGFSIAASICFEAVFGNRIRLNAMQADIMVNLSNDGWFGRSKAQKQHLNIARMRAIENNKYMIRATNNGITAVINNQGNVVNSAPQFSKEVLIESFGLQKKLTPYAKFGDNLFIVLALVTSILLSLSFRIPKSYN